MRKLIIGKHLTHNLAPCGDNCELAQSNVLVPWPCTPGSHSPRPPPMPNSLSDKFCFSVFDSGESQMKDSDPAPSSGGCGLVGMDVDGDDPKWCQL